MSVMTVQDAIRKVQAEVEQAKATAAADEAAKKAQAAADQGARERAQAEALAKQEHIRALLDAAYLVAAADGSVSPAERQKLSAGLSGIVGDVTSGTLDQLLDGAGQRFASGGVDGMAKQAGQSITDASLRRAVFLVAAGAGWLDGGVGVKQGLALQALARAFEIPMNEMHQLMAEAAKKR